MSIAWIPGCGAEAPAEGEAVGTNAAAIYGGVDDTRDAAVVALRLDLEGSSFERCTGVVVAPNLVLTARHCVTPVLTGGTVTCDARGKSPDGPHYADAPPDPERLHVFTGPRVAMSRPFTGAPYAVARVLYPPSSVVCDTDLAALVLASPLGVAPLPVRLGRGAAAGERVRVVGYGRRDDEAPIGTRARREGVSVLAVGPKSVTLDPLTRSSRGPLGAREFETGKGSCAGDSGGPAIAEASGAVLGVASRGGDCSLDGDRIYTSLAAHRDFIEEAFAAAGATPLPEPDEGAALPAVLAGDGAQATSASVVAADPSGGATAGPRAGEGCAVGGASPAPFARGLFAAFAFGIAAFTRAARRRRRGSRAHRE